MSCHVNVETAAAEFEMEVVDLKCDTNLRITFRNSQLVYLVVSFQRLVTLCGKWDVFSGVHIFVYSCFQKLKCGQE